MSGQEIAQRQTDSELAEQKVARIAAVLESDKAQRELAMVLPPGVTFGHFARVAKTALMEDAARQSNPEKWLVNCDPTSLLTALVKCASDGLLPDGRQAALVKRGTSAVYQPMIGGFRHIAGEYGWTIRTHAVYAADEFEFSTEPPSIYHRERFGPERGELVAAYAVARHRDGRREQIVLGPEEIAKRRAKATTDNVWREWPATMWEKSAGRAIFDQLAMSEADRERLTRVLEAIEPTAEEHTTKLYGRGSDIHVNTRTGEIIEGSPAPTTQAEIPADQPAPATPGAGTDGHGGDAPGGEADAEGGEPSPPEAAPQEPSEADELAALEASMFVAPLGKYGPEHEGGALTIGEIYMLGAEGKTYIRGILGARSSKPSEYRSAIETFARSEMPEDWAAAMAKRQEA